MEERFDDVIVFIDYKILWIIFFCLSPKCHKLHDKGLLLIHHGQLYRKHCIDMDLHIALLCELHPCILNTSTIVARNLNILSVNTYVGNNIYQSRMLFRVFVTCQRCECVGKKGIAPLLFAIFKKLVRTFTEPDVQAVETWNVQSYVRKPSSISGFRISMLNSPSYPRWTAFAMSSVFMDAYNENCLSVFLKQDAFDISFSQQCYEASKQMRAD
jgi:hypothetical protein